MEACPKVPMLSFDLKICNYETPAFGEKILAVRSIYLTEKTIFEANDFSNKKVHQITLP